MRALLPILATLLLLVPADGVRAQADASACAAIPGDPERLACYDAIFRAEAPVPAGSVLVLQSTQQIPARPTGRAPATMTIACEGGELGVSFAFAGQLLSETGAEAAITFQTPQTGGFARSLPVSANNTAITFRSPRDAEVFLGTIEGARNVIVRITPVRQRSIQAEFNLRANAEQIAAIRTGCAG